MIYDVVNIWRKIVTDLMNYEAVYRTAPATPGLLITKELFRTFLLSTDNLCSCLMRLCQWLPGPIAGNSQPDSLLMTGRWSDWSVITCPGVARIYFRRRYTHDWHCQCCSVILYPYYLYLRLSSTPACATGAVVDGLVTGRWR